MARLAVILGRILRLAGVKSFSLRSESLLLFTSTGRLVTVVLVLCCGLLLETRRDDTTTVWPDFLAVNNNVILYNTCMYDQI